MTTGKAHGYPALFDSVEQGVLQWLCKHVMANGGRVAAAATDVT